MDKPGLASSPMTKTSPKKRIAIYAGSFDPPTDGHLNIIERGLALCDELIVAVSVNTFKTSTLSVLERVALLKEILQDKSQITVTHFENKLLADYAKEHGVHIILRGLRCVADYEYELQMALANKKMAPQLETVFMMTESRYSHLSSSLLKEIIQLGGSGHGMIHPVVERELRRKLKV